MHPSKTKILRSVENLPYDWIDIYGMMIEILKKEQSHRYLERLLNLDVSKRIGIEFHNRSDQMQKRRPPSVSLLKRGQTKLREP